jgi:hypothetical protein
MDTKLAGSISRDAGFDRHLVKPADPDEIFALLGDFVRGREVIAGPKG